ncbi:MAG TPA: hypothetical protein DCS93_18140 [Microscillaceae bacterium]|nr:hypothetical protein [Microscillaceae bacterium]
MLALCVTSLLVYKQVYIALLLALGTLSGQAQMRTLKVSLLVGKTNQVPVNGASIYLRVPFNDGSYRTFNPSTDLQGNFEVYLNPGQDLTSVVFDEISKTGSNGQTSTQYKVREVDVERLIVYVDAEIDENKKATLVKDKKKENKTSKDKKGKEKKTPTKEDNTKPQLFTVTVSGLDGIAVDNALIRMNNGTWVNLDKSGKTTLKIKQIELNSTFQVAQEGHEKESFEVIHQSRLTPQDSLSTQSFWRMENNGNLIVITLKPRIEVPDSPDDKDTIRNVLEEGTEKIKALKDDFNAQLDTFERKLDTLRTRKFVDRKALNKLAQDFASYRQKMQKEIRRITNAMIITLIPDNDSLRQQLLQEPIDTVLRFLNRKRVEIQELREAQAIQKRRSNQTILAISVAGILIIFLVIMWYLRRLRMSNRNLTSQNTLINLLIGEVNHRVKNNLFSISSKLRNSHLKAQNEAAKTTLEELIEFTSKLSQLQAKLDFTFFSTDQKMLHGFQIERDLQDMVDTVVGASLLNPKPIVQIQTDLNSLRNDHFSIIGFCAFELANNICKYAFNNQKEAPPELNIVLTKKGAYICLQMQDNGKGMPVELFDAKGRFNFEQLNSSKGLRIIHHLTLLQQGNFVIKTTKVHQEPTQGAYFECNFKF